MSVSRFVAYSACIVVLTAPAAARAQDAPPMPKPGPEHAVLKMDVGTWDAAVEINRRPRHGPDEVERGRGEHPRLWRSLSHH